MPPKTYPSGSSPCAPLPRKTRCTWTPPRSIAYHDSEIRSRPAARRAPAGDQPSLHRTTPALAACPPGNMETRGRESERNTWDMGHHACNSPIGDVKLTTWMCKKNITHASIPAQRIRIKPRAGIALTYGCKADLLLPFPWPLPPPPPPVVKFRFRFTPSPRPTPAPPGPRFTAVAPGPFAIRCRLPRRPCACAGANRRSSQSQVRRFAFDVGDGGECAEGAEAG